MVSRFDRTPGKTARARLLRNFPTGPEYRLWYRLRGAQMAGCAFRRQHPVGPYILDFYCPAVKLAVELDGDQHATASGRMHDTTRTRFLGTKGVRVLRFSNHELRENLEGVLDGIHRALEELRH